MNNIYVATLMCRWAKYKHRGIDGGLGFKRKVSFVDPMPPGESNYDPEIDEDCLNIDLCMRSLQLVNVEFYEAVRLHYLYNGPVQAKLNKLSCSKQTFYNHIDRSHQFILGWLNDLAAGIALPHQEIERR